MVLNKRQDELIGSFDNYKTLVMVFYEHDNDVGFLSLRGREHTTAYRFTTKKEVDHFIRLLTKMKNKIQNSFCELEHEAEMKEINEKYNIKY